MKYHAIGPVLREEGKEFKCDNCQRWKARVVVIDQMQGIGGSTMHVCRSCCEAYATMGQDAERAFRRDSRKKPLV